MYLFPLSIAKDIQNFNFCTFKSILNWTHLNFLEVNKVSNWNESVLNSLSRCLSVVLVSYLPFSIGQFSLKLFHTAGRAICNRVLWRSDIMERSQEKITSLWKSRLLVELRNIFQHYLLLKLSSLFCVAYCRSQGCIYNIS